MLRLPDKLWQEQRRSVGVPLKYCHSSEQSKGRTVLRTWAWIPLGRLKRKHHMHHKQHRVLASFHPWSSRREFQEAQECVFWRVPSSHRRWRLCCIFRLYNDRLPHGPRGYLQGPVTNNSHKLRPHKCRQSVFHFLGIPTSMFQCCSFGHLQHCSIDLGTSLGQELHWTSRRLSDQRSFLLRRRKIGRIGLMHIVLETSCQLSPWLWEAQVTRRTS